MTDFEARDEYADATNSLEQFGADVEKLIKEILRNGEFEVHSVTHRVKSRDSVKRKLTRSRNHRSVDDLTDVLGLRVITYFPDQVDAVSEHIEQQFEVDPENSTDKRALLDPDRFGYLSRHFIVNVGASRRKLPEWSRYAGIKFEIQVRSILQHAWAEIEHDLGYKRTDAIPPEVRRRFSRLAGLLELADAEFERIRDDLAQHEDQVGNTIKAGQSAPLDQSSLLALLEPESAVQRMDARIATGCGTVISPVDTSYIGDRVVDLREAGLISTDDLLNNVRRLEEPVVQFAIEWLMHERNPDEYFSSNFDPVSNSWIDLPAGISLVYLERYLRLRSGHAVTHDMVHSLTEAPAMMEAFRNAKRLESRQLPAQIE